MACLKKGAGIFSLKPWDIQILAGFTREMIVDLIVPRNRGPFVLEGIAPPGMIFTFADQSAALFV
jgi:hypothetical protein